MRPSEALDRLIQGNERFAAGRLMDVDIVNRRRATATSQAPFAAVVTCADSRVAPEIIFDATLGDLYVVRTAANVVDELVLASLRFAVEAFGTPLIVVVGHHDCGAIKAVCAGETADRFRGLADEISPSLQAVCAAPRGSDVGVDEVARAHAAAMGDRVASDVHLQGRARVLWAV